MQKRKFLIIGLAVIALATGCQSKKKDNIITKNRGVEQQTGIEQEVQTTGIWQDVKVEKDSTADESYTIMVYMVGSDLESQSASASIDLAEMLGSGLDLSKCNLVVYTGGSSYWHVNLPSGRNTVLQMTEENGETGFDIIGHTDTAVNMGEAQTLADFLKYTVENYDTEHYALICWDHGGGSLLGFGSDELNNGDGLTLDEMKEALGQTSFNGDNKLDWVGFDACIMADMEVVNVWKNYAEYMVASQETEPGYGWNYNFLKTLNLTSRPEKIGKSIVDHYVSGIQAEADESFHPPMTLSCMDLSKAGAVTESIDDVFAEMTTELETGGYVKHAQIREKLTYYPCCDNGEQYDLVDLGNLAELVAENHDEAKSAVGLISEMITYQKSNIPKSSGVSIYFPYAGTDIYEEYREKLHSGISVSENCEKYMASFMEYRTKGQSSAAWSMEAEKKSDDEIVMKLTDEQLSKLAYVSYSILLRGDEIGEEDWYFPVLTDCRTAPDENGEIHISSDQNLIGVKGETLYFPAKQLSLKDGREIYALQDARVYNGYHYIPWMEQENVSVLLGLSGKGKVSILNIETESAGIRKRGKSTVKLSDWECMGCFYNHPCMPTYSEEGVLLPYSQWEKHESSWFSGEYVGENFALEVKNTRELEGKFVCQIVAVDVNGNSYASEIFELPGKELYKKVEENTEKGKLTYHIYENYAEVGSYEGEDEVVEISEEIQGVPVERIGREAFDRSGENLKKVILPGSIKKIEETAFSYCSVSDIEIPEGVLEIGEYAFEGTKIEEITIPENVEKIGLGAFASCENLTEIKLAKKNKNFSVVDGALFSKDKKTLLIYPAGKSGKYTIPDGVEKIAASAFAGTRALSEVNFPDSLKVIGNYAFYDCYSLNNIKFPDNLERVGCYAFAQVDTGSLYGMLYPELIMGETKKLYIGGKLAKIGKGAFENVLIHGYEVSEDNERYSAKDGSLFNKYGDVLIYAPAASGS